jgi:hypothetical protein
MSSVVNDLTFKNIRVTVPCVRQDVAHKECHFNILHTYSSTYKFHR